MKELVKTNEKMEKLLEIYEETRKDLTLPRELIDYGYFCFNSLEYIAAGRFVG